MLWVWLAVAFLAGAVVGVVVVGAVLVVDCLKGDAVD
jgi:hypothetical protein